MVERFGTFNRMFELHHIDPSTKDPKYKNLMQKQLSAEQIEEVDKCTLLCNKCHSIIHAQNITANLRLSVAVDGREVSQEFDGWMVCDVKDKTLTFITNQRFLLQPCQIKFGSGSSITLCVIEIERDQHLLKWMHNIEQLKGVYILALSNGELLMKLEHLGQKRLNVTQKIGFPITALNLSTDGQKDDLWIRNGIAMKKSGEIYTKGTFTYQCELL